MYKFYAPINLRLFDEGAAGGSPAAGTGNTGEGAQAGSTSQGTAPGKKGDKPVVIYGKQPAQAEPAKEPEKKEGQDASVQKTPEQRAQEYAKIRAEYKDLFDAETQNIINKRFREMKTLESNLAAMNPIMDILYEKYGTTDLAVLAQKVRADSIEALAEAANMTPEQYEEVLRLRAENKALKKKQADDAAEARLNAQIAKWHEEAAALVGTPEKPGPYPNFNLKTEIQNDQFLSLLKSGVSVKTAYEVCHMNEILAHTAVAVAKKTEEGVLENIKAKGNRPEEAAAKGGSGIIFKADVSKLTKEDRAEIARRVMRGERIEF